MAYALVTEGMTETERLELDDRLLRWRAAPDAVVADPPQLEPKSREEAIAEWGTSPEAEAALAAMFAETGMVTA